LVTRSSLRGCKEAAAKKAKEAKCEFLILPPSNTDHNNKYSQRKRSKNFLQAISKMAEQGR
jgi:hypothetical protein